MLLTVSTERSQLKAKLFRGLADPTRLCILETLLDGPRSVGEIVDATELGQSNVSNHLACLKDCGLVTSERKGRNVIYRTSDPRVNELLATADELLADVARGVYDCTRYREEGASRRD